ncbi:hypothetical protein MMC17_003065 [Xylographa soralifera]|nr:hypothetical protein [Xylographa soralifera]
MSSPSISNTDDFSNQRAISSPTPSNRDNSNTSDSQDVAVRRMGLKVLYTFDDQNKTNCLARWPQVINIRTAYLDETTQVGVIELKTCIQAIVTASPELVAKLAHDYTVYAYDYSEYDTPLVGQGMLSWVLASSSTTPSAPASQSRTMVTGRVCKNLLALFSNGVQETLEVKLRLVPVPTSLQSEYLESMRKYRDLSKIMPEGFDTQAWTNFLQANPGILSMGEQSRSQSPMVGAGQREVGIEHVQRLFNEGYRSQNARLQDYQTRRDSLTDTIEGQNEMYSASPLPNAVSSTLQNVPQQNHRRSDSRAYVRGYEGTGEFSRRQSIDPGYASSDDRFEEGPTKKRAKVTKADWPNKNCLAKNPESLRVVASTAASIRVFQPTATRPSSNAPNALEEPPRAPTPIPRAASQQLRPPIVAAKSGLGRMSFAMSTSEYTSPYASSDPVRPPESAMTSPEDSRLNYMPCDPGSSPPIVHDVSPTPSSPMLPPLPRLLESETTNAVPDGLFEIQDDEENQNLEQLELDIVAEYNKQVEPNVSEPKSKKAGKKRALDSNLTQQEKDDKAAAWSRRQARNASGSKALSRTASSSNLKQGAAPASDPIRPTHGTLQRSQSWSGQQSPHAASDMPMGSEGVEAPRPRSRAGCNAKRKQAIQSKLATSIAAGEMPSFCENCGAIETPTWRKAYSKIHSGGMELVQLSDAEGGILACVTLETNEDGTTKLFKIIKKTLLKTDKDFIEILLCNPCGLWLHNHKCMRPKSIWEQRKDDNPRKGGGGRRKKSTTAEVSNDPRSGAIDMPSDTSSPMDGSDEEMPVEPEQDDEPQLPSMNRQRAMSAQMAPNIQTKSDVAIGTTAVAALQRAIQSSPGRFLGTKHVPIEVEDSTPKPTRRVLFPSPRHQTVIGLGGCDDVPEASKSRRSSPATAKTFLATVDTTDKENCPPPEPAKDPFDDLFDELPKPASCPSSPSPSSRLPGHIFRTPTKTPSKHVFTTGDFFSSAAKAFLHAPRTPSRTPNKESLAEMTPFTRHLNQMLSDANGGDSPSTFSPSKTMDFLSLPPLENSADVSSTPGRYFRSEDFDFGTMCSDGIGMPSSPPGAWFGVYEDPREGCSTGWAPLEFGSSPLKTGDALQKGKAVEGLVTVKTEDDEGNLYS